MPRTKRISLVSLRVVREKPVAEYGSIRHAGDFQKILMTLIGDKASEYMVVACLDANNQPTCFEIVCKGSLNTVRTAPRELFKLACAKNAKGILLAHNHPSGHLEWSAEDRNFTEHMVKCGELLGIEVYDHVLVTTDGYLSMLEQGEMP